MSELEIEYVPISEIMPYEKNARRNDGEAIEKVAASIKASGFQQPILVDDNNIIITGHTRLKAALSLGIDRIPVAHAIDLTPEQVKAYRLADNRVAEYSEWDFDVLLEELESIEMDLGDLGFGWGEGDFEDVISLGDKVEEDESEDLYPEHLKRTLNLYNLSEYDRARTEGMYDFPLLKPVDHIPKELRAFPDVINKPSKDYGVHFHVDDYRFSQIWGRPEFYIEKLKHFDCVCTPDFSVYYEMPRAMKIWNVYRQRLFGQMCQDAGLTVIPLVVFNGPDTYDFCFDGLPECSTLEVSSIGFNADEQMRQDWKNGVTELIRRKKPKRLILMGGAIDFDFGDIEIIRIKDDAKSRIRKWKDEKDGE